MFNVTFPLTPKRDGAELFSETAVHRYENSAMNWYYILSLEAKL
jgi:hypothetical protein